MASKISLRVARIIDGAGITHRSELPIKAKQPLVLTGLTWVERTGDFFPNFCRCFLTFTDGRDLPDADLLGGFITDIFDAIIVPFTDTRMEPDIEPLASSIVNAFHYMLTRINRELDRNAIAQKQSRHEQDGSEIKSVELERLIAEGNFMLERQQVFELLREQAAYHFENITGSAWRPYNGSKVANKAITAAVIDSRDFETARKNRFNALHMPEGSKVALLGSADYEDYHHIFDTLDKVRTRFPDMILVHGGSTKGAELIASRWASARGITQITFKPDWRRDGRAAPFKRNDRMLDIEPVGVLAFGSTGVALNLYQKAQKHGIPANHFA